MMLMTSKRVQGPIKNWINVVRKKMSILNSI
jgi:hypothetical protein